MLYVPILTNRFRIWSIIFHLLFCLCTYAIAGGVLLDRYGPQRLLTIACLICVLGTFLFTGTTVF